MDYAGKIICLNVFIGIISWLHVSYLDLFTYCVALQCYNTKVQTVGQDRICGAGSGKMQNMLSFTLKLCSNINLF